MSTFTSSIQKCNEAKTKKQKEVKAFSKMNKEPVKLRETEITNYPIC